MDELSETKLKLDAQYPSFAIRGRDLLKTASPLYVPTLNRSDMTSPIIHFKRSCINYFTETYTSVYTDA